MGKGGGKVAKILRSCDCKAVSFVQLRRVAATATGEAALEGTGV